MSGTGLLPPEARAQYAALAALRWEIFKNGLRSNQGAFELSARAIMFLLYVVMGLCVGVGAALISYLLAKHGRWQFVPILFWVVCLCWQIVPVTLASFAEQFDLGILLRFPVRFGSYFLLYVIFGLVDVSTMLGGLACLGIWVGITVARPGLFAWTALVLAVFTAFNILLVRAIFAWIDRWLAQRKTREILGAVFLVMMLGLQLLNPALHQRLHTGLDAGAQADSFRRMQEQYGPWLQTANSVQKWLPPGLAAQALRQAGRRRGPQLAQALGSLGVLGLYALAAGGVLAARLRSEYRGESLGEAPSRRAGRKQAARRSRWLLDGSGPIAAVMEKDLRVLLRSLPLMYALGAPLFLVFIFGTMFHNSRRGAGPSFALALPLGLAYALIGFTQLFYNNLGAEGAGIQILFLSPTPIRVVLLAKNLFYSLLFALDAAVVCVLVSLRLGLPTPAVLAATVAWLLFALPVHLAAGNILSLTMPHRLNPGRIGRQRGSQGNALLALLIQVVVLGVGAAVFGLCTFLGRMWLATPILLVFAAAAVFAWRRMLNNADSMANARRNMLIETLVKAE